jgi:hypothetical protein
MVTPASPRSQSYWPTSGRAWRGDAPARDFAEIGIEEARLYLRAAKIDAAIHLYRTPA